MLWKKSCILSKEPWKSPLYSENSPIHFQKSPIYSERPAYNAMEGCDLGAMNDTCFQKKPVYSQKSPKRALLSLKTALDTVKRVLNTLEKPTCCAMESCDLGATNDTCFQKKLMYSQKSPKRALCTLERALIQQKEPVYNRKSSTYSGKINLQYNRRVRLRRHERHVLRKRGLYNLKRALKEP